MNEKELKELKEINLCPICLDLLVDPITLECQHNYCYYCISKYFLKKGNSDKRRCPNCNYETKQDFEFKINLILTKNIDILFPELIKQRRKEIKEEYEKEEKIIKDNNINIDIDIYSPEQSVIARFVILVVSCLTSFFVIILMSLLLVNLISIFFTIVVLFNGSVFLIITETLHLM